MCDVPSDDLGLNKFYPKVKTDHTTSVVDARHLVIIDKHILTIFHCTNIVLGIYVSLLFFGVIDI